MVLCLLLIGSFSVSAQREIYPWEPEFDSSYCKSYCLYHGLVNEIVHYNQFYSQFCEKEKINVIEVNYDPPNRDLIMRNVYCYVNGFLTKSYLLSINKRNLIDTLEVSKYSYNQALYGEKFSVTKIRKNEVEKLSYVFNAAHQLTEKHDSSEFVNSTYLYLYRDNYLNRIILNNLDTIVKLSYKKFAFSQTISPCFDSVLISGSLSTTLLPSRPLDSTILITCFSDEDYSAFVQKIFSFSENEIYAQTKLDYPDPRFLGSYSSCIQKFLFNKMEYTEYSLRPYISMRLDESQKCSYMYMRVVKESGYQEISFKDIGVQVERSISNYRFNFPSHRSFSIFNYEYKL